MSETHESHGGVKLYWIFCIILCVLTFLEWAVFEYQKDLGFSNTVLVASLSVFSLLKFVMVVGWYMHLRFDPKLLKNIFIFSLLLICGIAAGLLLLMT